MQATGCVIEMKKALKVSVWIGAFSDLDDLIEYVDIRYADDGNVSNDFWRDIGLDWFDDDFREAALIEGTICVRRFPSSLTGQVLLTMLLGMSKQAVKTERTE